MVFIENRFAICSAENPKALDVCSVLQINLHIFSFFGSTGAPTFQTFIQSKCTIVIGSKFGKLAGLQCPLKYHSRTL